MINQSFQTVLVNKPLFQYKKIPAHPIICWLSKLFRPLDPWVEIKAPLRRDEIFSYKNKFFVSPEQSRILNRENIS